MDQQLEGSSKLQTCIAVMTPLPQTQSCIGVLRYNMQFERQRLTQLGACYVCRIPTMIDLVIMRWTRKIAGHADKRVLLVLLTMPLHSASTFHCVTPQC